MAEGWRNMLAMERWTPIRVPRNPQRGQWRFILSGCHQVSYSNSVIDRYHYINIVTLAIFFGLMVYLMLRQLGLARREGAVAAAPPPPPLQDGGSSSSSNTTTTTITGWREQQQQQHHHHHHYRMELSLRCGHDGGSLGLAGWIWFHFLPEVGHMY